jgi:UDP-N-acetylmuramoyl-tripeptide--D-alanyl-D-alanine ligase
MILDLQQFASAIRASGNPQPKKVTGWSVDTRTQQPGDVYFALRGPNHDGHAFVPGAVAKGASGLVVQQDCGYDNQLLVPDTLLGLQEAGAWARRLWSGPLVAVTGSAGKTTTKDAIAHLLSSEMAVGRTIGNLNNHVGVPLSILRLADDARAAVLEMGMNHAGEIRLLARIAAPNIGVVTNVGYAHIEFFDSIEGIAAAKRELIEELPRDGVAVLNADDPRVSRFSDVHPGKSVRFGFSDSADVRAESFASGPSGVSFRALGTEFESGMTGRHAVLNFLAAIAVAGVFGIAPERLRDAVRSFGPGKMRGERIDHDGIIIWNDCYNSNPEAAHSMIDVLAGTQARRRIAVLGEMLELGHASEQLHREVGRYAAARGIDTLIGVRGDARYVVDEAGGGAAFFEDPVEAGRAARALAGPGDAVLFKASRGVRIERALEAFLHGPGEEPAGQHPAAEALAGGTGAAASSRRRS